MKFNISVKQTLSGFDTYRKHYKLSDATNGFFKPFENLSDVQQQLRTTLVSPLIAVAIPLGLIPHLIKNVAIVLLGMGLCDADLLGTGIKDLMVNIIQAVVILLVATVVALASAISLVTRTFGTLLPSIGERLDSSIPLLNLAVMQP